MVTSHQKKGISRLSLVLILLLVAALTMWAASFLLEDAVKQSEPIVDRFRQELPANGFEESGKDQTRRRWSRKPAVDDYEDRPSTARTGRKSPAPGQLKQPEPPPEPSPPDLIEDEFILSFESESDRQRFVKMAEDKGFAALATAKLGNSVRMRAERRDALERLLAASGLKAKYSPNYFALIPQPVDPSPFVDKEAYTGFGAHANSWLGIGKDNHEWGKGVTVAVIDTAITEHSLLNGAQIERISLLSEKDNGQANAGHGTAVASLIVGRGEEFQSVAPSSRILGIEVAGSEGVGDAFTLAKGIVEAVDRGAKVINVSLGTYGNAFILEEAVDYAVNSGATIVAAAGNDSVDQLSFPARYEKVVAVSGVDARGQKLPFVNEGRQVDLAAPAAAVEAAAPEDKKMLFSGTSAAAPFVSGLIAYLIAEERISGSEAVEILKSNSNDAGQPDADPVYGEGILNAERVLRREQKNIYDAALAGIYVEQTGPANRPVITVTAENRGTEEVELLKLGVNIDDVRKVFSFNGVKPGRTVSVKIPVDSDSDFKLDIAGSVDLPTHEDINTRNNARRLVMLPLNK